MIDFPRGDISLSNLFQNAEEGFFDMDLRKIIDYWERKEKGHMTTNYGSWLQG